MQALNYTSLAVLYYEGMKDYTFNCLGCGKACIKRITPSREMNPPRFCSNECKFKSQVDPMIMQEHACGFCGNKFTRYTPPSLVKRQTVLFCTKSCAVKASRQAKGDHIREILTYTCKGCDKVFEHLERANAKPFEYCTQQCVSKHTAIRGDNAHASLSHMKPDVAASVRKARSQGAIERNTGRPQSTETKQKIAVSCTGIPNAIKGKTFEEFYGPERAQQLVDQHSRKLKEGYASGKIKPNARSKSAPVFRGVQLRSQLEQRAIEFLEQRDGLIFGQTLLYEDSPTFVQWHCIDGKQHTYVPDLHDTVNSVVYEVKPAWCVRKPTDEMQRKMSALVASGQPCAYLTDEDIR